MGLLNFIKEAGEKLFGADQVQEAAASDSPDLATLNAQAADAVKQYIDAQNLGLDNLAVSFDGASGKVTLTGDAPSKEAAEKAGLAAGNVSGVQDVDNNLNVADVSSDDAQYHDVCRGDTLSAIAREYYGDAGKYMVIFEANKPMLSDPDKIYPGQKLRIPAQ